MTAPPDPQEVMWRWIAPAAAAQQYREKERLVCEFAGPASRDPALRQASTDRYISKQANEVWFTVFGPSHQQANVLQRVGVHAAGVQVRVEPESRVDDLLEGDCRDYRAHLTTITDIAVDLHLSDGLLTHQQALIQMATANLDPRNQLSGYLAEHSQSYRALAVEDQHSFWEGFYEPGPRANLSRYGHWLWNIVLGIDHDPWPTAEQVAQHLDIPWPPGG